MQGSDVVILSPMMSFGQETSLRIMTVLTERYFIGLFPGYSAHSKLPLDIDDTQTFSAFLSGA